MPLAIKDIDGASNTFKDCAAVKVVANYPLACSPKFKQLMEPLSSSPLADMMIGYVLIDLC